MSEQFDLVIIGAGPGGYSTALRAAELGMKVALVERDATVGGTCLNRGCIPSKALITATHTIDTVHRAAELGVNASVNGIDFGTLRDYRLRVVKTMVGGLAGLLAHRGITVFRANAAFHADETAPATSNHIVHLVPSPDQSDILTYHKADVPEPSGPTMDLTATNIVIATGAKPRPLPGNPFAGALIDSTQALEVNEFPSSAVIIGAGAIALEFASMWNAAAEPAGPCRSAIDDQQRRRRRRMQASVRVRQRRFRECRAQSHRQHASLCAQQAGLAGHRLLVGDLEFKKRGKRCQGQFRSRPWPHCLTPPHDARNTDSAGRRRSLTSA